ncbi:MAG TPA: hypothetical protein VLL08_23325 [Kineosporiaceae bacterium]|nr:hypothetical protein [Kineosporiaceae bacterium]
MGMVRRSSQRGSALILAAILISTVAACSGDDGDSPSSSTSASAPISRSSAAAGSPSAAAAPALPVLVSRDATVKELPIRVDLNELRVEGRVTRLTFTARNLAPEAVPGRAPRRWQIGTFFNDGINQQTGAAPDDAFSVDGVYLLDAGGAKRYLAARNAAKGCVCSGNLSSTFVSPGSGVVLTTVFAALPTEVTSVDVVVPGFGSFNGLAVSR